MPDDKNFPWRLRIVIWRMAEFWNLQRVCFPEAVRGKLRLQASTPVQPKDPCLVLFSVLWLGAAFILCLSKCLQVLTCIILILSIRSYVEF